MAERPAASTKPVTQKLLLQPGSRALVLNAPAGYLEQFPDGVRVEQKAGDGVLWVSYPKGKALPTDLNRDVVRVTLAEVRLEVVTQVAIDETWSALRAKIV